MIHYQSFQLSNGLRVHVIPDNTVRSAVINLAYDVGSRDEDPGMTGFAHLFEHLMFGGSVNIPEYDTPLQKVGGENNAFTTPDYTNYYLSVPSNNLETGFWLESDRMLGLSFDPRVLEVQRKVVIEEFKQRYLNRPYGDVWHILRPMAYQSHPYRWPVIGEKIEHVENATMKDVRAFFETHYTPERAVLTVAGDVSTPQVRELCMKWFEPIVKTSQYVRDIPAEPKQSEGRRGVHHADVPQNAIYRLYHMPGRASDEFYAVDLLSDLLGRGKSSRLHQTLVNDKKLFTSISASVTGTRDPGLLVIQGFIREGISPDDAEKAMDEVIYRTEEISDLEYNKVVNQAISTLGFSKVDLVGQATELSLFDLLGNPEEINQQTRRIETVSKQDLKGASRRYLKEDNSVSLHYLKSK